MKITLVLASTVAMCMGALVTEQACALENLSRGHNILLQRGLQIQALAFPGVTGYFDPARWAQSNFTTVHVWPAPLPYGSIPLSTPWGSTDYDKSTDLPLSHYPYAPSLVSYQFGDEQDITKSSELAGLASAMTSFRANQPNVITYTNQWGSQISTTAMRNYMLQVQPDMLCFDTYPFNGNVAGSSPTAFYRDMQKYRRLGLAGNGGVGGTRPIPFGLYTQTATWNSINNHVVSESEIRLNNFSAWAFGYKFVDSFTYDLPSNDPAIHSAVMFTGRGTTSPTPQFYQVAETNRQSLNLGPALVRLISTDVRIMLGQHKAGSSNVLNSLPSDVSEWARGAIPYTAGISVTNVGRKNNGLAGDVIVGTFKPLDSSFTNAGHADDTYFMIVNGLSDATGSAADCRQLIHLDFDFATSSGPSGIDSLLRLSRETGEVEVVNLVHGIGSEYSLDIYLDGGTGDLFKFNNGGVFVVPEPGALTLLSVGLLGLLGYAWRKRR